MIEVKKQDAKDDDERRWHVTHRQVKTNERWRNRLDQIEDNAMRFRQEDDLRGRQARSWNVLRITESGEKEREVRKVCGTRFGRSGDQAIG